MKRVISVTFLFIALQIMCIIPVMILSTLGNVMKGMTGHPNVPSNELDPQLLASAMLIFEVIMITLVFVFKWVNSNKYTWKEVSAKNISLCIPSALLCMIALNIILELLHLPDLNAELNRQLANTIPGMICLSFAAPICEELVFRDAIQGYLHRQGYKAWHCIITSALIFAIIHMNPIQIPFAFILGLFLGWLYYRTGSVMPGIVCHIINNTLGTISMIYENPDDSTESLVDFWGCIAIIVVCSIAFAIATRMLNTYFNNHPEITITKNISLNEEQDN